MTDLDAALRRIARDAEREYPNAVYVSHSKIGSIDCWRKHDFAYRQKLRPIRPFAALRFGRVWDAFHNAYHDHRGEPDARLAYALTFAGHEIDREADRVDAILVERGLPRPMDWNDELDEFRTLLLSMALGYHDRVGLVDSLELETVAVQVSFDVALRTPGGRRSPKFRTRGVIDRLALDANGGLWIIDAKSTKAITANYRLGWSLDRQLPRYAWALGEYGITPAGCMIDAAAKLVPTYPEMRQTPIPVLGPDGEPLLEPEVDEATGEVLVYKSGPRKGEPKMRKVTRRGLRSILSSTSGEVVVQTTHAALLDAIRGNGLDEIDYARELAYLHARETGENDEDPYFWRASVPFAPWEIRDAGRDLYEFAVHADALPPIPNESSFRCVGCAFKLICKDPTPELIGEFFTTPEDRRLAREREQERDRHEAELAAREEAAFPEPASVPIPF